MISVTDLKLLQEDYGVKTDFIPKMLTLSMQCYLLPHIKKHNIMQTLVRSFGPALHNIFLFSCGPMEKIIAQVCDRAFVTATKDFSSTFLNRALPRSHNSVFTASLLDV